MYPASQTALCLSCLASLRFMDPMLDSRAGDEVVRRSHISVPLQFRRASAAKIGIACLVCLTQRSCSQEAGLCLSNALRYQKEYSNPRSLPSRN